MMVMASNSDKYAAVGRERYEELWLEDSVIWNHQGNIGLRLLVEKVIWTLSKATSGKDSGDEEDMFVDDMVGNEGVGVSSSRLELALGNLGNSSMELVNGSSSVNVFPSSNKSLAMYEDFKFAMMQNIRYVAPKCMLSGMV
ncbi:hypothetical protein ACFX13_013612 [Malus domestica]